VLLCERSNDIYTSPSIYISFIIKTEFLSIEINEYSNSKIYIANRKLFNSMKRERCICSAISIKSPV
jgi:hypothetical protein